MVSSDSRKANQSITQPTGPGYADTGIDRNPGHRKASATGRDYGPGLDAQRCLLPLDLPVSDERGGVVGGGVGGGVPGVDTPDQGSERSASPNGPGRAGGRMGEALAEEPGQSGEAGRDYGRTAAAVETAIIGTPRWQYVQSWLLACYANSGPGVGPFSGCLTIEERADGRELAGLAWKAWDRFSLTAEVINEEPDGEDTEKLQELLTKRTRKLDTTIQNLSDWSTTTATEIFHFFDAMKELRDA